ncbi:MAG: outer membrane lipoprotein-sorting protein [Candidatus Eremiobacteraeota bacterium]|nr:outer membrane lipoprotein-sorting protein [Candidatus Eremiobacteraeota bacterium]
MKYLAGLCMLLIVCSAPYAHAASNIDARQLVDHLYIPSGQMPVHDLVIELEESVAGSADSSLVPSGKDKIYFKAPNKLRIDSVLIDPGGPFDGRNMIIIRDGINAWHYLSTGQYPVKKKADEPSAPLNLPFGVMRYPQDVDKQYTVSGSETIDGVQTSVVKITNPSNPSEEVTACIDRTRWVPLKVSLKQKDKGGEVTKKVLYKQIGQTKDGRYFPMKLEIFRNESLVRVVVYKAVAVNAGLDESLFQPMDKFVK